MDFRFYFTILFFVQLGFAPIPAAEVQKKKYYKHLENVKLPSSFEGLADVSLAQCVADCDWKENCFSFVYHSVDNWCELTEYDITLLESAVTSLPFSNGSNVYYADRDLLCDLSYTVSIASGSQQFITSPNYPSFYPHLLDEYWLIVKPRSSTIFISFMTIDVEREIICDYDYVLLVEGYCTSGRVIDRICGIIPRSYQVTGGLYILIRFVTDADNYLFLNHYGFSIKYYLN